MKKIALACLLAVAAALGVSSAAGAMSRRPVVPAEQPVSATDQAEWRAFRDKVQTAVINKNGWHDPDYAAWDAARATADNGIMYTNNAQFQAQYAIAREVGGRICGRIGC